MYNILCKAVNEVYSYTKVENLDYKSILDIYVRITYIGTCV